MRGLSRVSASSVVPAPVNEQVIETDTKGLHPEMCGSEKICSGG